MIAVFGGMKSRLFCPNCEEVSLPAAHSLCSRTHPEGPHRSLASATPNSTLAFLKDLYPMNLAGHRSEPALECRCANVGLVNVVVVSASWLSEDHLMILETVVSKPPLCDSPLRFEPRSEETDVVALVEFRVNPVLRPRLSPRLSSSFRGTHYSRVRKQPRQYLSCRHYPNALFSILSLSWLFSLSLLASKVICDFK